MKRIIIFVLLFFLGICGMYSLLRDKEEFLYFTFLQNDGYASFPPFHENYINKLIVDVAVKQRFNLSKEIDSFEGLPPHYYSYFFEERTRQKINFQKIFSSHLKEEEKFPLKVVIFYSIDGGEIRDVMYNFEVRCFRHCYISPDLVL